MGGRYSGAVVCATAQSRADEYSVDTSSERPHFSLLWYSHRGRNGTTQPSAETRLGEGQLKIWNPLSMVWRNLFSLLFFFKD